MRAPWAALLVLAFPSAAFAGHVESGVLREGSPLAWWKKNRTQILERLKGPVDTLETLVGPKRGNERSMYLWVLLGKVKKARPEEQQDCWGKSATWREDSRIYDERYVPYQQREFAKDLDLAGDAWLEKVHEYLAGDTTRAKRLLKFVKIPKVREELLAGMRQFDTASPERAIADLVLLLQFLRPENKAFFLNGYSTEAILPNATYSGLYPAVKWDAKSIEGIRSEVMEVLRQMGPAAVALMDRALRELRENGKSDGKTVAMPAGTLAVATGWSTKETRFPVPTHASFRKDVETLIVQAGRTDLPTDAVATPEQAAAAFRKYLETFRKQSGVRDVVLDKDERTSFVLVVVTSNSAALALRKQYGGELDGVPLRIVVP